MRVPVGSRGRPFAHTSLNLRLLCPAAAAAARRRWRNTRFMLSVVPSRAGACQRPGQHESARSASATLAGSCSVRRRPLGLQRLEAEHGLRLPLRDVLDGNLLECLCRTRSRPSVKSTSSHVRPASSPGPQPAQDPVHQVGAPPTGSGRTRTAPGSAPTVIESDSPAGRRAGVSASWGAFRATRPSRCCAADGAGEAGPLAPADPPPRGQPLAGHGRRGTARHRPGARFASLVLPKRGDDRARHRSAFTWNVDWGRPLRGRVRQQARDDWVSTVTSRRPTVPVLSLLRDQHL